MLDLFVTHYCAALAGFVLGMFVMACCVAAAAHDEASARASEEEQNRSRRVFRT